MKKIYTFAFAAAMALSASAAPTNLASAGAFKGAKNPTPFATGVKSMRAAQTGAEAKPLRVKALTSRSADWDIIVDPAGEKKTYTNNGVGLSYNMFGSFITDYTGLANVVWGENNEVYINNIILGHSAYVKGTLSADGKKITVQLPQNLEIEDLTDFGLGTIVTCLSIGDKYTIPGENGEPDTIQFSPLAADENVITYTVGDDGTVTGDFDYSFDYDDEEASYVYPDRVLGLFAFQETDPDDVLFYEEACWHQQLKPFDKVENSVPDGVTMDPNWSVTDAEGRQFFVKTGFGTDKVYIQGLTEDFLPGGVIIGDVANNKITFTTQYVGYSTGYSELVYLLFGEPFETKDPSTGQTVWDMKFYDDNNQLFTNAEFVYDSEAKTIKPATGAGLLFNVFEDKIDYSILDYYVNPEFAAVDASKMAAAPANPTYIGTDDYTDLDGSLGVRWKVPATTADGTPLNPDNMSWSFYINGQVYAFAEDVYFLSEYDIPAAESYTELPLNINTSDIWYAQSELTISIWEENIETVGLKVFNKINGETYETEVVTTNFSGIRDTLASGKTIEKVEYYDLNGRRISNPTTGFCIARTFFTDGTQTTKKLVVR